jgi:cyclopropane fatty-acyl-phospholipid synthase-like methyltransferase
LDLGCGDGRQIADLLRLFGSPTLVGLDRSQKALRSASRRYEGVDYAAHFVRADAEAADQVFDVPFDIIHEYGVSEMIGEMRTFLLSAAAKPLRQTSTTDRARSSSLSVCQTLKEIGTGELPGGTRYIGYLL